MIFCVVLTTRWTFILSDVVQPACHTVLVKMLCSLKSLHFNSLSIYWMTWVNLSQIYKKENTQMMLKSKFRLAHMFRCLKLACKLDFMLLSEHLNVLISHMSFYSSGVPLTALVSESGPKPVCYSLKHPNYPDPCNFYVWRRPFLFRIATYRGRSKCRYFQINSREVKTADSLICS